MVRIRRMLEDAEGYAHNAQRFNIVNHQIWKSSSQQKHQRQKR